METAYVFFNRYMLERCLIIQYDMNILIETSAKTYSVKPLFENATFGIEESDKIGIIGANGSGENNASKVIAGTENAGHGQSLVRIRGKLAISRRVDD